MLRLLGVIAVVAVVVVLGSWALGTVLANSTVEKSIVTRLVTSRASCLTLAILLTMTREHAEEAQLQLPDFCRFFFHWHCFHDIAFHGVMVTYTAEEAFFKRLLFFWWGISELIGEGRLVLLLLMLALLLLLLLASIPLLLLTGSVPNVGCVVSRDGATSDILAAR